MPTTDPRFRGKRKIHWQRCCAAWPKRRKLFGFRAFKAAPFAGSNHSNVSFAEHIWRHMRKPSLLVATFVAVMLSGLALPARAQTQSVVDSALVSSAPTAIDQNAALPDAPVANIIAISATIAQDSKPPAAQKTDSATRTLSPARLTLGGKFRNFASESFSPQALLADAGAAGTADRDGGHRSPGGTLPHHVLVPVVGEPRP